MPPDLEGEQEQKGHHQAEQTHGLGQGEAQNGVGEELLLQGGVAGITDDEGAENRANSSSGSGDSDCGSSGSDELGSGVNVLLGCGGGQGSASGPGKRGLKRQTWLRSTKWPPY